MIHGIEESKFKERDENMVDDEDSTIQDVIYYRSITNDQ